MKHTIFFFDEEPYYLNGIIIIVEGCLTPKICTFHTIDSSESGKVQLTWSITSKSSKKNQYSHENVLNPSHSIPFSGFYDVNRASAYKNFLTLNLTRKLYMRNSTTFCLTWYICQPTAKQACKNAIQTFL